MSIKTKQTPYLVYYLITFRSTCSLSQYYFLKNTTVYSHLLSNTLSFAGKFYTDHFFIPIYKLESLMKQLSGQKDRISAALLERFFFILCGKKASALDESISKATTWSPFSRQVTVQTTTLHMLQSCVTLVNLKFQTSTNKIVSIISIALYFIVMSVKRNRICTYCSQILTLANTCTRCKFILYIHTFALTIIGGRLRRHPSLI